jgi:hypothetical protein
MSPVQFSRKEAFLIGFLFAPAAIVLLCTVGPLFLLDRYVLRRG